MTGIKAKNVTHANIEPENPFVGQWWHDTTHDAFYVWVGRWMKVSNDARPITQDEGFDPIEAYDRVKKIL